MSLIEQCFASGGDLIINTIEVACDVWPEPMLFNSSYDDEVCTTEDGRVLTFVALAYEQALPAEDNSAFQSLVVAMDNTNGIPQARIEEARAAGARITLTNRIYLASDTSYPARRFRMTVLERKYGEGVASATCGFYDLLNTALLRNKLTTLVAPGLKYI
jgi:hypothetical protein